MKRLLAKILRRLLHWAAPPPLPPPPSLHEPLPPNGRDVRHFHAGPSISLAVFWKNLPNGCGPGIIAYIHQQEIIAFDCFGPVQGHFHIHMHYGSIDTGRLLLPEADIPAQIERSLFELRHNLLHWQQIHPDRRIRDFRVDPVALDGALESAADYLNVCHEAAEACRIAHKQAVAPT